MRKKLRPKPSSRLLPIAAPRRWLAEPPQEAGRAAVGPREETGGEDFTDLAMSETPAETSHIVDVEEDEHIEEVGGGDEGEEPVRS